MDIPLTDPALGCGAVSHGSLQWTSRGCRRKPKLGEAELLLVAMVLSLTLQ